MARLSIFYIRLLYKLLLGTKKLLNMIQIPCIIRGNTLTTIFFMLITCQMKCDIFNDVITNTGRTKTFERWELIHVL